MYKYVQSHSNTVLGTPIDRLQEKTRAAVNRANIKMRESGEKGEETYCIGNKNFEQQNDA